MSATTPRPAASRRLPRPAGCASRTMSSCGCAIARRAARAWTCDRSRASAEAISAPTRGVSARSSQTCARRARGAAPMTDALLRWRTEFPILETCTYLVSHSLGAMPREARDAGLPLPRRVGHARRARVVGRMVADQSRDRRHAGAPARRAGGLGHDAAERVGRAVGHRVRPRLHRAPATHRHAPPRLPDQPLRVRGLASSWCRSRVRRVAGRTHAATRGVAAPDRRADRARAAARSCCSAVPRSRTWRRSSSARARSAPRSCSTSTRPLAPSRSNLTALGVEFAVGGSVKWLCGGPGAGYLYVRPDVAATLAPAATGWAAHARPFDFETGAIAYADGGGTVRVRHAQRRRVDDRAGGLPDRQRDWRGGDSRQVTAADTPHHGPRARAWLAVAHAARTMPGAAAP